METQRSRLIALVIDSLSGGGAEKVVIELAKALRKLGHKAVIVSFQKRVDYSIPDELDVYYVYDTQRVKLYRTRDRQTHADAFLQRIESIEANVGARFDLWVSNLDECHYILSACGFENTLYVAHNAIKQTLVRALKMGPFKYFRQRRLFKSLENKHVIAVSDGLKDEIERQNVFSAALVTRIYNPFCADTIRSLSLEPLTQAPTQPYIIHIGRFAKQKRHDVLLKSLRNIPSDIKLVCLSNNSKGIQKLAHSLGVAERVILPGFQDNPYKWIKHAKALVLTSDFEGFGNVLLEALLCGTPVVSTNCPCGPNEILVDELADNLVDTNAPQAIADKIRHVVSQSRPTLSGTYVSQFAPNTIALQYLAQLNCD